MTTETFDTVIIGAGMSGLAAGIRLAMFDKKVCILEQHFVAGGLNSYYQRGERKLDVGLHAMTNYVARGTRGAPLTKLLKQLRIPYEQLELQQQIGSKVVFPEVELNFTNDFLVLREEIASKFPREIDGFDHLVCELKAFNETALDNLYQSARQRIAIHIKDQILIDMLLFPLLIYGSSWEDDMDYSQFVIMFKSIFLEGFCRPKGGVRTILNLLIERFTSLGGELRFKQKVKKILTKDGVTVGVELIDGSMLNTNSVLSSIGYPETLLLLGIDNCCREFGGKLSFTETILFTKEFPRQNNEMSTIVFYNRANSYYYKQPVNLWDERSAVICLSNNFTHNDYSEGVVRVTNIANYNQWKELSSDEYQLQKQKVLASAIDLVREYNDRLDLKPLFSDVFTPLTVERYTQRINGAVYGSEKKLRNGAFDIQGLALCGTDQGFLGIVGAMLSGISMANFHVLSRNN